MEALSQTRRLHPATVVGITEETMARLLKSEIPANALALYAFYAYVSTHQKTQQVWCTGAYVAKALGWSERKVASVKKTLRDLELIEDHPVTDAKGRVTRWYVIVRYIVHPAKIPPGGDSADKCFGKEKENSELPGCECPSRACPIPTFDEFEEWVGRHSLPVEYHGDFYEQMDRNHWTIQGQPVWDWRKVFLARLVRSCPQFEKDYGSSAQLWREIEQRDRLHAELNPSCAENEDVPF